MSAVMWVSLIFQAVIALASINVFGKYRIIRKAQPEWIQDTIVLFFVFGSYYLTWTKHPIFRASVPWMTVGAVLMVLAILAPLLGLAENKFRKHDIEIFDKKRFRGHLGGNFFGAAAAIGFFWAAQHTKGFIDFTNSFQDASAFNIVLPVTTMIVFAFVRQQQTQKCPNLDRLVKKKELSDLVAREKSVRQDTAVDGEDHLVEEEHHDQPAGLDEDWQSAIRGYSLSDWNQICNCIYLSLATFVASSTILYLFSFTLLQAKDHNPASFSIQMAGAIIALMGFLLICGSPLSWENKTVYFTFLTGMPGVLIATMVWLALLAPSFWRNVFAITFVSLGYVLYCATVVLGVVRRKSDVRDGGGAEDNLEIHYFAAAILGGILAVLLGVLYLTH